MNFNNTLSLTRETYPFLLNQFHEKYIHQITTWYDFKDDNVKKCASEILFHDLYAIADKKRFDPKYEYPTKSYNPGMDCHYPLLNCGLLPDPSLASNFFGQLPVLVTRIVLWVRSFPLFNKNFKEAHELLGLYNKIKAGAAERLSLALSAKFNCNFPKRNFIPDDIIPWTADLEWRLYTLTHPLKEEKRTIGYFSQIMHSIRPQSYDTGISHLVGIPKGTVGTESAPLLTKMQMPLREMMFLRQQLFLEIVQVAESYPLFGRTSSIYLKSAQQHRIMTEQMIDIIKATPHFKIDSVIKGN